MLPYQDPEHEGNSSAHHSGRQCYVTGCPAPAGTAWSQCFCFEHNIERMDRISKALNDAVARAQFSEAVADAIAMDRKLLLDVISTQHALIIAAGGKITVLPEHWQAKITRESTRSPKGKDGPMIFEIGTAKAER